MADRKSEKQDKAAPPEPVPPMPGTLPTTDAERPHTSPLRHGEKEPVDPTLPPEPGHDPNP
ncbi:MAG TPA: hypothetical protein VGN60_06285 [Devosia sp.]|jgi:hypothetical protein|nr:hypothetical protein [Devosia sp.]